MAGSSAPVGNNGAGDLHDRFPVRIRHVGDQHFPFLELMNITCILNDMGNTLADLGADSLAGHNDIPFFLENVSFHDFL